MAGEEENRRYAPATLRNRDPILRVLEQVLPSSGTVLEIGSGTGEHAVYFAPRLPHCIWQPSEPDPQLRRSIQAWQAEFPAANLRPPIALDVRDPLWPVETTLPDPPIMVVVIKPLNITQCQQRSSKAECFPKPHKAYHGSYGPVVARFRDCWEIG